MSNSVTLPIKPYARLLTMLGEQLIKNERIALIELIKNSYDADANWVKVTFENFGKDFEINPNSRIVIEDDGHGMSASVIKKHWLNPATPVKKIKKRSIERTSSGRVIQGEKGIGRFAILKLGRKINIITRAENEDIENIVEYDFTRYDDEFLTEDGREKELFIDDIKVTLTQREPELIIPREVYLSNIIKVIRLPHGTRIEISNLKGTWSENKLKEIYRDLTRFESIFASILNKENANKEEDANKVDTNKEEDANKNSFIVALYKDDVPQLFQEDYIEMLNFLLQERAVFRIENGRFNADSSEFFFLINGQEMKLSITDPDITGIDIFRNHFGKKGEVLMERNIECGSFDFGFYIFDFAPDAPERYKLDRQDKNILRGHRIYLYRDGVRVYPYGEPDDDWLHIDADRGTKSAGSFLSNDQVVGYINITQKGNPKLQDKTNREGLIEQGNATSDFIALIRIILAYLRAKPYARYRNDLEKKKKLEVYRTELVQKELEVLKQSTKDNDGLQQIVSKIEKDYKTEKAYLIQRAEITEELAGVGLSVETASHDIMAAMGKATTLLSNIIKDLMLNNSIDLDGLQKELYSLQGLITFIEAQLKDIQLLFRSTKQKRRPIRVKDIIEKITRIYRSTMDKENIQCSINEIGSPLIAKTTDAVLLQLFLNLFDNSIFWLQQVSREEKKIEITLNGSKGILIFSDNGPGIKDEDMPYIFEPFYSGKGNDGRGLGLYIAKQLLERYDYSIELADIQPERILSGANFVISFISESENND
jgi:Signal transduction histidine kinase regulating C4-dicarboxylate transport system